MKLRFFLKSDLSLTWLGWLSVTLIAAVVAVLSYAQLQDRLQRQMLNAVRETDVIAEFCSRQPTLRNEDCTFEEGQARVQLSDQEIWLLLAEAQVLSSDEILSYSALKTVETLPAGVAHLVGFLRESGRSTESGLALLRSAARACSSGITTPEGDNRSAEGIRVAIAMMLTFFPLLVNSLVGFRSVGENQLEMMRSFSSTRWQIFFKLRFPSALPFIFAGLEMSSILCVIGAIFAEFMGARRGLGTLILQMNFDFDIPGEFSIFVILSSLGLLFFALVRYLRRRVIFWSKTEEQVLGY